MINTIKGQLKAEQDDFYKSYVFEVLEESVDSFTKYITMTECPNWDLPNISIGDVGYVVFDSVQAGEEYFKRSTKTQETYNYTNCYIVNFIRNNGEMIDDKEFKF